MTPLAVNVSLRNRTESISCAMKIANCKSKTEHSERSKKSKGETLTVRLDQDSNGQTRHITFSLWDYNNIDHGYAATVHKAQGVTFDRTHVLASKYFDQHSAYVAMSRHRDGADIYVSLDEFPNLKDLSRSLGRKRTKDVTLDYSQERNLDMGEDNTNSGSQTQTARKRPANTPNQTADGTTGTSDTKRH